MNTSAPWLPPIFASLTGTSHASRGEGCQDSVAINHSPDGRWTSIVVCDGAGSARLAHEGSRTISKWFSDELIKISDDIDQRGPGSWTGDRIIESLIMIRTSLRAHAKSDDLSDYHSTVVAVLLGPQGGIGVQIGDGGIFGAELAAHADGSYDYATNAFLSGPENGEFANETFFITESRWIKRLRVFPLPKCHWVALGSDGGMSIALNPQATAIRTRFLDTLFIRLADATMRDARSLLTDIVSIPEYAQLTDDDTTLVFCVRAGVLAQARGLAPRSTGAFATRLPPSIDQEVADIKAKATRLGGPPKAMQQAPPTLTTAPPAQLPRQSGKFTLTQMLQAVVATLLVITAAITAYIYLTNGFSNPSAAEKSPDDRRAMTDKVDEIWATTPWTITDFRLCSTWTIGPVKPNHNSSATWTTISSCAASISGIKTAAPLSIHMHPHEGATPP